MPALELNIYGSKSQATSAGSPPAWTAILFPLSSRVMSDTKHFSRLPLMLVKGAVGTTQCVLHWLEVRVPSHQSLSLHCVLNMSR